MTSNVIPVLPPGGNQNNLDTLSIEYVIKKQLQTDSCKYKWVFTSCESGLILLALNSFSCIQLPLLLSLPHMCGLTINTHTQKRSTGRNCFGLRNHVFPSLTAAGATRRPGLQLSMWHGAPAAASGGVLGRAGRSTEAPPLTPTFRHPVGYSHVTLYRIEFSHKTDGQGPKVPMTRGVIGRTSIVTTMRFKVHGSLCRRTNSSQATCCCCICYCSCCCCSEINKMLHFRDDAAPIWWLFRKQAPLCVYMRSSTNACWMLGLFLLIFCKNCSYIFFKLFHVWILLKHHQSWISTNASGS